MQPLGVKWGPLVYGPLVHGAPLVRDRAVVAMEAGISYLLDCQEQLAKRLSADLKGEDIMEKRKKNYSFCKKNVLEITKLLKS